MRNFEERSYEWNFVIRTNDAERSYNWVTLHVDVLPAANNGSGKIMREEWTGVPGKTVASIPLNTPPNSVTEITSLQVPNRHGDNYGVRIRGYIEAPIGGYYTFFVASDDHSEVWLSTDMDPANKARVAYLTHYVDPGQYTIYPSQKSVPILLQKNQKYYIEVLHKEGAGRDHLTVGWELPTGRQEFPIPGPRLFPLNFTDPDNENPSVTILSPSPGDIFTPPASFEISADATDTDGNIVKVEFYNGTQKLATDFTAPYSFLWKNVDEGVYNVSVRAFDSFAASDSASVQIFVGPPPCVGAGTIQREVWEGIPGKLVSSIPVNSAPSSTGVLTIFESPYNVGDNYGSRIRGYVCVPVSGDYTFWIASDDHSELWLSADENPANKVKIASVTGYTLRRQWEKYPSQKSTPITLRAGRKYYIEALQKEATGADHLSVGWQLPNGTLERPIQGNRLIPYRADNSLPVVTITKPTSGQQFSVPADITIEADAKDADGTITKVEFYAGPYKLGEDLMAPYSFTWMDADAGVYDLTIKATDNDNGTTSATVNVEVIFACEGTGTLLWDVWWNVPGTTVASIPVNTYPSFTQEITSFETQQYFENNYGARVRGYICVPQTGNYTFWIASDDNSELWLSANADPADKVKIASVSSSTKPREWAKYPSQTSAPIHLIAGHRYYIEALHKEGSGNDHVAVGWQLPDGTLERPIPGNRLSPSLDGSSSARTSVPKAPANTEEESMQFHELTLFPNPATTGLLTLNLTGDMPSAQSEASIEITSVTGKVIHSGIIHCQNNCHQLQVDIDSRFSPGVYVVNAVINRTRFSKKLIIR